MLVLPSEGEGRMSEDVRFPDEPQVGTITLHCSSCGAELPVLMEAQQKIVRIAELEAEVERLKVDIQANKAPAQREFLRQQRDEAQAQLRDGQGQAAALARAALKGAGGAQCLLCGGERLNGDNWNHEDFCPIANLPAASKAILAAAEKETL